MSEDGTPMDPTLEIVWQQDATAILFVRDPAGALTAGELTLGKPTAEARAGGDSFPARRLDVRSCSTWRTLRRRAGGGGSARAIFASWSWPAIGRRGPRPSDLDHGGGRHAFWGATLDQSVQATLTDIAAALPAVSADAFDGDRDGTVHDLYPVLVDQIARTACVPTACSWRPR
jgi:hypothetical protein